MTNTTRESRIYNADQEAKNTAFRLVPNAATTGYTKAVEVLRYIQGSDKEPKFYSVVKQQKMKAARLKYLAAVNT